MDFKSPFVPPINVHRGSPDQSSVKEMGATLYRPPEEHLKVAREIFEGTKVSVDPIPFRRRVRALVGPTDEELIADKMSGPEISYRVGRYRRHDLRAPSGRVNPPNNATYLGNPDGREPLRRDALVPTLRYLMPEETKPSRVCFVCEAELAADMTECPVCALERGSDQLRQAKVLGKGEPAEG